MRIKYLAHHAKLHLQTTFVMLSLLLIVLSFAFHSQRNLQFELLILLVIVYVSFSMLHHYLDKSLTLETMLEYILIASLAVVLLLGLVI